MRRLGSCALVAFVLAGCGGGEEAPEAEAPNGAIEVALSDFAVEPASLSLEPGAHTLLVVNEGAVAHALVVGDATTAVLEPGDSEELAVELSPGDVVAFCPVGDHRGRGMEATVAVAGDAPPEDDTGTGEDSGDYRY